MFTGIIEEVGRLSALVKLSAGARITVACETTLRDLSIGDSIAVNGVCLTAVEIGTHHWSADLAPETLKRTNLGTSRLVRSSISNDLCAPTAV